MLRIRLWSVIHRLHFSQGLKAAVFTPINFIISPSLRDYSRLNCAPVAKISKLGRIISVALVKKENKLSKMKGG